MRNSWVGGWPVDLWFCDWVLKLGCLGMKNRFLPVTVRVLRFEAAVQVP